MKNLITAVAFLLCFQYALSAPIDVNKASQLALEFSRKETRSQVPGQTGSAELSLAYTALDESSDNLPFYYVFDKANQEGFILISGDDRTVPVLGYSDHGNFDPENLPVNFKDWLETIQKEIQYLKETAPAANYMLPDFQTKNTNYTAAVSPLLNEIVWDQRAPYNNLCPMDGDTHSYTGCVATAMAQIMRYHQYPAQGKGSHSYTSSTRQFQLSVDFSQSVYDWENMPARCSNRSTDIEIEAVAKLMYDCGVAVDMDYTNQESGAYSDDVALAFPQYFDYDPNIQIYFREYFTYSAWVNLIKEELNQERPIYISGFNAEAGHAFVCDGYDTNDLFHINWGWGGSSNGYFAISALNPYFQGIGGSSGGFNFFQTIIAGIQPPTTDSKVSYTIYIEDDFTTNVSSIARNQKVVLNNTLLSNQGIHDFNGEIAVGLYQNNDLIEIFDSQPVSFQSKNWTNISWDFNVPLSIPNGTYELYPIYKGNDQTDWSIIRSISMISISLGIVISDETIEFFTPADALPQLRIPEGGFTYSDLYSHFPATFHIRLENTGKEAYTEMWILIMSEDETLYETVASNIICISQGETIDVDFTGVIPVPSGAYKAVLYYATPNNPVEVAGENRLPIVVNRFPPTTPELAFKVTPAVNPVEVMKNGQMTVSATIENEGLSADGNMHVFIYQFTGGNHLKTYHQPFTLAQDESIFFQMEVPIELDKGKYYLMLQYVEGEDRHYVKRFDEQVTFLVVEGTAISELKDREPFHIYPNPVRDYLLVETQETIQSLRIFNVSGVQIRSEYSSETRNEIRIPTGNLAPGIYFLQITTTQGTVLKKFIKQ